MTFDTCPGAARRPYPEAMGHSSRVDIWAGIGMLAVCLLIGVVEGASVFAAASPRYFVGWLMAFALFLAGIVMAAMASAPPAPLRRVMLVAAPVVAAGALALGSPNRGGMSAILVVLSAAICAYHLGPWAIVGVIAFNSVVVIAAMSALGPLVAEPSPVVEMLFVTLLYALLQAGSAVMVWSQQRLAKALQDVTVAHVELRGAAALLAESTRARERLRISRELHDVLGHQLTVLSVELEVASHRVEEPSREHVLRARGLAKELLADVRSVVGTERGRGFDLQAALIRMTQEIPRPRVHLDVDSELAVDDERAVVLVRAVQEITTNAIRHSQADNLWISLAEQDGALRLEARDDGSGAARFVSGHGLDGLRERVQSLGGRVEFDGSSGFHVRVGLPPRLEVAA